MAVTVGYKGRVTMCAAAPAEDTIGEMGSWSISGPTRNMIPVSAFGDTVARQELGTLTGQTITFSGYHDGTSTALRDLVAIAAAGTPIYGTSDAGFPAHLRLWANTDTDKPGYGCWSMTTNVGSWPGVTGSTAVYVTNMELGQAKDGLGTISFTLAAVGADFSWSTDTG